MDKPRGTQPEYTMTPATQAFRELRISVVENGFIVSPGDRYGRGEDNRGCFVFATPELLAAWMLKQAWQMGEDANG